MERNRHRGGQNRIIKEKNGKKKTVDARGPGKRRNRVISNMVEGVTVVRRLK